MLANDLERLGALFSLLGGMQISKVFPPQVPVSPMYIPCTNSIRLTQLPHHSILYWYCLLPTVKQSHRGNGLDLLGPGRSLLEGRGGRGGERKEREKSCSIASGEGDVSWYITGLGEGKACLSGSGSVCSGGQSCSAGAVVGLMLLCASVKSCVCSDDDDALSLSLKLLANKIVAWG